MSWFATKAFEFQLAGDDWVDQTVNHYEPKGDGPHNLLAITRQKYAPEQDLEATFREMEGGDYQEREIVRSELTHVGPLSAQDVSVIARNVNGADYHRVVSIHYFDTTLNFQWMGPAVGREIVDQRVERTLETIKFRKK
jgi:hypothetical protein